ncbi:DUF4230 domain-containing protein [Chitinophaga horti]|uniref:DUF4230 domain-containing protein n=1 Tax=Chitinophaga horti TaxID=2920382 RepID=A0ABY6IVB3_9BACT|nr:DUF4230 domain-containing protein [Chitinophaga horti]UYQ91309.1 DUF4230 domain-containing protein [Chitinophaga horti]
MKKIIGWLLLVLALIGVFFIGKQFGGKTVSEQVVSNSLIVREIAELASLEVQGNASIKRSNVENDGTWSNNMRKLFMESTIWVNVPYTAKFGVDLDDKNFDIDVSEKRVTVHLPVPKLLSYELKIDKMETSNKKGWLMFSDDETYTDVQKKLYQTSRGQLEHNVTYLQSAKTKIQQVIARYYEPLGYEVRVQFGSENAVTVLPLKKD